MEKKMMPAKKTVTKTTKPKSPLKQATAKQPVKKKSDFDVDAFVFEVDISKIEDWVKGMCIELDDPEFEWPSYDEQYWLGRWLTDLPYYRAHNIQKTLVSARESAILGLYDKTKKRKN